MVSSAMASVPPEMRDFIIGIIGMGDMGKMYARRLSDAGWK
jgi:prephenate dehydrogenase (NADP+)